MSFLQRHSWVWISVLGIIIRLMYAFWLGEELLTGDAFFYIDTAKSILAGESYLPEWPPALPYYLSVFGLLFGQSLWTWVFAMLLLYLFFNWVWKNTAALFLDKKWVNLGMLVFVLMPAFVHYSVAPLSQLPLAIIILALVYLLHKNGLAWQMGFLLSLGVLFRSGTLSLIPLFLIYFPVKKRSHDLVPFLLSFLFLIGIWQYKSWQMTERFVWINDFNTYNLYVGNNPWTPDYKTWWLGSHDERRNPEFQAYYQEIDSLRSLDIRVQSEAFASLALGHIQKEWPLFLLRGSNKFRAFFAFDTYTGARLYAKNRPLGLIAILIDGGIYVLFGCLAILSLVKKKPSVFEADLLYLMLGIIFFYAIPYVLAFAHPTYHFPHIPLFVLFALKGIEEAGIKELSQKSKLSHTFVLSLFLFIQLEWIWHMSSTFS